MISSLHFDINVITILNYFSECFLLFLFFCEFINISLKNKLSIIFFFLGCYGVDGESDSIMSSASENSTEPWFCDACKCGVSPSCELCPNQDGIFKETDAGRLMS